MLDYQRLDVYQCAIRFVGLCFRLMEDMPRGLSSLTDQLRRAVMSIPLNIAEGAGRTTVTDKARFYTIARGSAMECGAILDVLVAAKLADDANVREAGEMLVRIVEMLTKLARAGG